MLAEFLQNLFEHGHVGVGPLGESESACAAQLQALEVTRRSEFPGEAPAFSIEVAVWAATIFYRACQAATFRDLAGPDLDRWLDVPLPEAEPATRHYSADLVLQFLPDLMKLAGQAAPDDPLLAKLRGWANQWPLSSVGMKDVAPVSLVGIVDHPGLLRYYADRVIARRDAARLSDPAVAAAVRRSLGLYASRFPELG